MIVLGWKLGMVNINLFFEKVSKGGFGISVDLVELIKIFIMLNFLI